MKALVIENSSFAFPLYGIGQSLFDLFTKKTVAILEEEKLVKCSNDATERFLCYSDLGTANPVLTKNTLTRIKERYHLADEKEVRQYLIESGQIVLLHMLEKNQLITRLSYDEFWSSCQAYIKLWGLEFVCDLLRIRDDPVMFNRLFKWYLTGGETVKQSHDWAIQNMIKRVDFSKRTLSQPLLQEILEHWLAEGHLSSACVVAYSLGQTLSHREVMNSWHVGCRRFFWHEASYGCKKLGHEVLPRREAKLFYQAFMRHPRYELRVRYAFIMMEGQYSANLTVKERSKLIDFKKEADEYQDREAAKLRAAIKS